MMSDGKGIAKERMVDQGNGIYEFFADCYDEIMAHVPYQEWVDYLDEVAISHFGKRPEMLADLACGTGQMLQLFRQRGYNVAGFDGSKAMLGVAEKRLGTRTSLQYSDLRKLPDDRSYDWLICCHDSLNYLVYEEDLLFHFQCVKKILADYGLYSTDLVTGENIMENFAGVTTEHRCRNFTITWSNEFISAENLLISDLTFVRSGVEIGRERHFQRYYAPERLIEVAKAAGLNCLRVDGDYDTCPPDAGDSMINLHFSHL